MQRSGHRSTAWRVPGRVALLLCAFVFGGCPADPPLRVALTTWVGYESLFLAKEFGWLPPGVRLERTQNLRESVRALHTGRVDAAGLTLDEMLRARSHGIQLVAVAVLDVSAGADQLLARPGIEDIASLRGRRIGLVEPALSPMLLARALQTAGLGLADVETVLLGERQGPLAAWTQSEDLDAIVAYEPAATAVRAAGARRLFDTRDLPETVFDVLAIRCSRQNLPRLRALLAAHFRAIDYIYSQREDASYRLAANQGLSHQQIQAVLGGIVLPGLEANRRYLAPGGTVERVSQELTQFMQERGLLDGADTGAPLVNARYLPRD